MSDEDNEEDLFSLGSESLIEETSSDEYTPYTQKRGTGKRRKGRVRDIDICTKY